GVVVDADDAAVGVVPRAEAGGVVLGTDVEVAPAVGGAAAVQIDLVILPVDLKTGVGRDPSLAPDAAGRKGDTGGIVGIINAEPTAAGHGAHRHGDGVRGGQRIDDAAVGVGRDLHQVLQGLVVDADPTVLEPLAGAQHSADRVVLRVRAKPAPSAS